MGDRANFGFRQGDDIIYLYGHWAGGDILGRLARALERARPRWSDEVYATRICITTMVDEAGATDSETGWGISVNSLCDNEHNIPIVTWGEEPSVSLYEKGAYYWSPRPPLPMPIVTWSMESFVHKYGSKNLASL